MAEAAESTSATDQAKTIQGEQSASPSRDKIPDTASTPVVSAETSGEKRKVEGDDKPKTTKTDDDNSSEASKPKKAKIAMPPAVSSSLMDVEKYKLEAPPPENNTNEADVKKKITTANLMLFGLHPLIKAEPLKKMLEDYGSVQAITVRSAFASRYGHVSFSTVEEAQKCYVAIHGAKLLHKTFLVQPSMASPAPQKNESATKAAPVVASAGEAASAAVAASAKSNPAP